MDWNAHIVAAKQPVRFMRYLAMFRTEMKGRQFFNLAPK